MNSNLSYSPETPKLGQNWGLFAPCDLEIWHVTLKNNRAPLLLQAFCIISQALVNISWSYSPETPNPRQNQRFFVPCDLEIWQMTLENNRAPNLTYFKPCASFHSHRSIQTVVTVQKRWIWVKIGNFCPPVTLKFDRWPWKTIGHLFYATSSCVHDFIAICEFKRELQSGNG